MNLATVAAGVFLTAGITSYSILEYQQTLQSVKKIQYEPLEDVDDGISMKEAIEVVRRNEAKRKRLIFKLHNTLQESLDEQRNQ